MNIRSLTRGDAAVIGAALLLFIASFLAFFSIEDCDGDGCTSSAWSTATFPMLPTVHLAALIGAGLLAVSRMSKPVERKAAGLTLEQWGIALSVFVAWGALWSMFANLWVEPEGAGEMFGSLNDHTELGVGAYLTLVGGLAQGIFAVLAARVPSLQAPLMGAPRSPYPSPQPPAGYGYPGQPQPGQPQPGQPGGYGYPGPAGGAPSYPGAQAPAPQPPAATGGPSDFSPFWFAVPVSRPLMPEDGSSSVPIAELTPGVWYLAVEQRGAVLIAQTQDGRRGALQDTSGIQRG